MDSHVRSVRSYNKTPAIQVPEPPDYISPFLSLPPPNSANLGASHLMTSSGSPLDSSAPISPWAIHLIGDQVHQEKHKLTVNDNGAHLRAFTNG